MEITTQELRQVFEMLIKHIENKEGKSVAISQDFYWSIPADRLYDNYEQPAELTIGQLSDDLVEVKKIGSGVSEPLAYGYVWLAAVLRAIGDSRVA